MSNKVQLAFSMVLLIAVAGGARSQAADTTPPKITLNGSPIQGFGLRDNYREEGAMVNDAVDGNLFDALKITGDLIDTPYAGEYKFAGGKVTATGVSGYLLPFTEKPGGFKNGNAEVKLYFKSSSSPLNYGFLNFDNGISYFFTFIARGNQMLGNLSQDKPVRKYIGTFVLDHSQNPAGEYYGTIRVLSGTVDTSKPGAYYVRYNATDNAGNAAQAPTSQSAVQPMPPQSKNIGELYIPGYESTPQWARMTVGAGVMLAAPEARGGEIAAEAAATAEKILTLGQRPTKNFLTTRFSPSKIDAKYDLHVLKQKEFGDISREEFRGLIDKIWHGLGNILEKVREGGDVLRYDMNRNIFSSITKEGNLKTFFKPDETIQRGLDYWFKQK